MPAITIDPHGLFETRPTFSHVTSSAGPARFVATSGQVGADVNGVVPNNLDDQIALAFANLQRCIDAAGASVTDILKLVYYIVDYDHKNRPHVKPLLAFLKGHRPATSLVPIPKLAKPEFLFEVEAYLAVPQRELEKVDVVVVGAGLSGLKAAYDVQRAGYSCAVVEARDRVGGKTWSVDQSDGAGRTVELGAAWINDTNQSEIFGLVQALGLETVVQNTDGNIVQQDINGDLSHFLYGGQPQALAEPNGAQDVLAIREKTEEACQAIDIRDPVRTGGDLDKITLEEWATSQGGGKTALASVAIWTRVMLGLEPRDVSALFFLDYCKSGGGLVQTRSDQKNGGQYRRLVKGTQSISIGLAGLLKSGSVHLNSPVRIIQQNIDGVYVTAGKGSYLAKRVIVSVPTPLYKDIAFQPPLPAAKLELSQQNKLGYINKVILRYGYPWWRQKNLCGMLQSFKGPVAVSRDTSVDGSGQFSLTCFCAGEPGLEHSKLQQSDRFKVVVEHIKSTIGAGMVTPEPLGIEEWEWSKDLWAQGCPCPASPPGLMTQFESALRSSHGKVHFVGTETSYEWKGYMDGAVRSGARGAREVIQTLGNPKL
ncbi:Amine oxidase [Venustampulla echinocandica]|uniref:Amine oxidase n=1 Tax=Venustampulla echinocandica TaxID=2656787 RepID=A0A370T948_9HELO|nr:Amine oxidase [Venustampulla echinocandica]RDL30013.1 Amine oxidase [Venustampulla echinocandica]